MACRLKIVTFGILLCIISIEASDMHRRITKLQERFCASSNDQKRNIALCAINDYPDFLREIFMECAPVKDNNERLNIWVEVSDTCPDASISSTSTEVHNCVGRKLVANQDLAIKENEEDALTQVLTIWLLGPDSSTFMRLRNSKKQQGARRMSKEHILQELTMQFFGIITSCLY